MKKSAQIGCLFLVFLAMQARAQAPAHLKADSTRVETGNALVLHVSVSGLNTPDSIDFSPWKGRVDAANLLSVSGWLRKGNSYFNHLTVVFFDADSIVLPPLYITFHYADTARTNALTLEVYPTPTSSDLQDMAPIKDIYREPTLWADYLPFAVATVVGAAVLALLFWWYKRPKKVQVRHRTISLSPHELAQKKLELLQQKAIWRQGAVKEHCAELTFILREYLEKQYQVPALESTSQALLLQLRSTDFPESLLDGLEKILLQADLAKFAKAIPPDAFYPLSLDFARALVARTAPQTPAPSHFGHPLNPPTIESPL
jgi:hypothetical protein